MTVGYWSYESSLYSKIFLRVTAANRCYIYMVVQLLAARLNTNKLRLVLKSSPDYEKTFAKFERL